MKMSLSWLKRYVDIDVPVDELCDKMVMSGFEVEEMIDLGEHLKNVVVGRVDELVRHPDSDHMFICQVEVGAAEKVQIVTGAQNLFVGAYVPAALDDSYLPNGAHIKAGKLRGVASNGMLCSGEELCLTEADYPGASVNGIMILKDEPTPGTDMREILHLDDYVIDFKITANRPDCQSVLGVAREIAVALKTPFRGPQPTYKTVGGDITKEINVTDTDYDLCPRYIGRVVKNLRIGQSPEWMRQCLISAGMRPINNIVDITNFVMLETGMPMHAFDMRDIRGREIIIRRADEGEEIVTLDGKPHTLTNEMLVIADAEGPSCLAGIMGGLNSEIKDDTTDLFLECAKFRRDNVRRTCRALGVRTEASARFEHGVDVYGIAYAMDRALQLIDELDAGDILDGIYDRHAELPAPRHIEVKPQSVTDLLGVEVPTDTMVDILNRLGIVTVLKDGVLCCDVPSHRDDVEGRADLAEEVMRVYGYDHIVGTPMTGAVIRGRCLPERLRTDAVKARLIGEGCREIATYSFISGKAIDTLRLPEDDPRRNAIVLRNPLGEEYSTMRTQLVTSMLTVLATNCNRKNPAARLFEASKRFIPHQLPMTEQPDEDPVLCIGLYGEAEDFYTLKGLVEQVMSVFGAKVDYVRSVEPYLHPGRQAAVMRGNLSLGTFGEVHPDVAAAYGLEVRAYIAEISLKPLLATSGKKTVYKALPRFPAVERDLALVCDEALPVGEIEKTIRNAGGKLLESVTLFDVYRGVQVGEGKKSVAYSLFFRSPDGTLSDEEIAPAILKIREKLSEKGCNLRA